MLAKKQNFATNHRCDDAAKNDTTGPTTVRFRVQALREREGRAGGLRGPLRAVPDGFVGHDDLQLLAAPTGLWFGWFVFLLRVVLRFLLAWCTVPAKATVPFSWPRANFPKKSMLR